MIAKTICYVRHNRERITRLSREGGWIIVGQIAMVVGALVLVRVLTEYLDTGQHRPRLVTAYPL